MGNRKGQGYSKNLITLDKRTPEERTRIAKMGVEARLKKKQQKMALQNCMKELLNMRVSSNKQKELLKQFGFKDEDTTNKSILMVALFKKGLTGDVGAIKEITDMMDKLEMFEDGKNVTGQNITINLIPKGDTTFQLSEQQEQDILNAQNGILDTDVEEGEEEAWNTDTDWKEEQEAEESAEDDWGNDVYNG